MFIEIPLRENNNRFTCERNGERKNIRYHPPPDSLNDLFSILQWEVINKNLLNASDTMGKWILQYNTDNSALLSQITAYREKT